jgi:4-diphosphocytidyl-2-C-methyl-D-erythritol kinase
MSDGAHVKAHAKVNWSLEVLGLLPGGYHRVRTLIQTIDLYDELEIRMAEGGDGTEDLVYFRGAPVRLEGENLAGLAARAFLREFSTGGGVRIILHKNIPIGAGLGGGSADAAAVLGVLREIYGVSPTDSRFMKVASSLGADVPFGLKGGLARAEGSGSEICPLPDVPSQWLLLLEPSFSVSTAWAYGEWDRLKGAAGPRGPEERTGELYEALKSGDPALIAGHIGNDLEGAVIPSHPEIRMMKESLMQAGALGALMSGSGSVVFGIFPGREAASRAGESLAQGPWKTHLVRTLGRSDL